MKTKEAYIVSRILYEEFEQDGNPYVSWGDPDNLFGVDSSIEWRVEAEIRITNSSESVRNQVLRNELLREYGDILEIQICSPAYDSAHIVEGKHRRLVQDVFDPVRVKLYVDKVLNEVGNVQPGDEFRQRVEKFFEISDD